MKVPPLPPLRRVLQVVAPLVAVATLMLGLRIGGGEAVRAAVVFAAPPARPAPDGSIRLAWQLLTFLDDRGVKETIPMQGLTVIARANGHESRWSGASNKDGIAEVALAFPRFAAGDPVELEVRVAGDEAPLAAGMARHGDVAPPRARAAVAARPTVRRGNVALDVVIEGERLVPGFPTPVWVRASPPAGIAPSRLVVTADPEPGLLAEVTNAHPCASGWAELPMTAQAHVVGAKLEARLASDHDPTPGPAPADLHGEWFGPLPVAPGAFFVSAPRTLAPSTPAEVVLVAPNPRDVVYAELDDESGRVVAAALPVTVDAGDPTPRARFALPPLAPGLYWVVASGEPRGAEHMTGAAVARAVLVGSPAGAPDATSGPCTMGPWLAERPASGTPRWVALDGLPARSSANRTRHRLGLLIGLVSLLAAGVLETVLLVGASREARIALQLAELDEDEGAQKVTAKSPGGGLAIALLASILGFALLAVLLVAKG